MRGRLGSRSAARGRCGAACHGAGAGSVFARLGGARWALSVRLTPRPPHAPGLHRSLDPQSHPHEEPRRGVRLWVSPSRPRAPTEWPGRTRRGLRFWCMGRSWEQVTTSDLREARRGPPCRVRCCPLQARWRPLHRSGPEHPGCACLPLQPALGDESAIVVHRVGDVPGPGLRSGSWCGLQSRPADSGRELLRAVRLREGS